jgi:hypothetical protein
MPRKKQPKALAAIQEDEEMEVEEQPGSSRLNEQLAQLLEEVEQQGTASCTSDKSIILCCLQRP